MKLGLLAHKLHRSGSDCALLNWARKATEYADLLDLNFQTTEAAFDVLHKHDILVNRLSCLGSGRSGSLMRMVSRIAGGTSDNESLDGVIFFIDPVDPTSLYPEALALKRQCIIHKKPFVATLAGAMEFLAIEKFHKRTGYSNSQFLKVANTHNQTLALIAHDTQKSNMLAFASDYFEKLSKFNTRVATGTTGQLLNKLAWSKGWPESEQWIHCYQSGPLGGDAQIAELILNTQCHKVVFFEDPHVARQHEADIQLLDRAVYSVGESTSCLNSDVMARRWAACIT